MTHKCYRCKNEFHNDNMMYEIETPNHIIYLCIDCAIDVEDDLMHLAYKTTTDDTNCTTNETEDKK